MEFHLKTLRSLTQLLDNKFSFMGIKFGIDPIIGFIPWFGDLVAFLLSLYIIWIGTRLGMPQPKINQMISYVVLDFVLGLVPIVGDIADFFYRANLKNMQILEEFIKEANIIEGDVIHPNRPSLKPST